MTGAVIRRCSAKKVFLTNFVKFTGKHLCQSLIFDKVAGLHLQETQAQMFSCEFCEIFKNTFFNRTTLVAACVMRNVENRFEIKNMDTLTLKSTESSNRYDHMTINNKHLNSFMKEAVII